MYLHVLFTQMGAQTRHSFLHLGLALWFVFHLEHMLHMKLSCVAVL